MCLIFHKPEGVQFPEDSLENAYYINSDGFGIMFHDKGRVRVHRELVKDFDSVLALYKRYEAKDMAGHLRFNTKGSVCKAMTHPLKILHMDEDGHDLYMMHNGTIYLDIERETESDTWCFANSWLRPLLKEHGLELFYNPVFQALVTEFVGVSNKLLFLDDTGKWTYINKRQGNEKEVPGCWVSNTYSLGTSHPRASYYLSKFTKKIGAKVGYDLTPKKPTDKSGECDGGAWSASGATTICADCKKAFDTTGFAHCTDCLRDVEDNWKKTESPGVITPWNLPIKQILDAAYNESDYLDGWVDPNLVAALYPEKVKDSEVEGDSLNYGKYTLEELKGLDYEEIFKWAVYEPEVATDLIADLLEQVSQNGPG